VVEGMKTPEPPELQTKNLAKGAMDDNGCDGWQAGTAFFPGSSLTGSEWPTC
jgi:hypothetical protein